MSERTVLDRLLSATAGSIHRFVILSSEQADATALWIAHTWVIECFRITPYLNPQSATKQSGKTRLLEVLRPLCARPVDTDGMTPAALIRTVDNERPTLLLDESDASFNGSKELAEALRGIPPPGVGTRYQGIGGPRTGPHLRPALDVRLQRARGGRERV